MKFRFIQMIITSHMKYISANTVRLNRQALVSLRKVLLPWVNFLMQAMFTIFCWTTTGVVLYNATIHWVQGDNFFKWIIGVSFLAVISILFTPGVINPVVHDINEHWINLRTGSSNLNGGCKILGVK